MGTIYLAGGFFFYKDFFGGKTDGDELHVVAGKLPVGIRHRGP